FHCLIMEATPGPCVNLHGSSLQCASKSPVRNQCAGQEWLWRYSKLEECEVARWVHVGPRGLVARWRPEHLLLVQGFLFFFESEEPLHIVYVLSLSSIVAVTGDGKEAAHKDGGLQSLEEPCLLLQAVVGGRSEAVRLRFADVEEALRWQQRFEAAKESAKTPQPEFFVPTARLWQALEVWKREAAINSRDTISKLQQELGQWIFPAQALLFQIWLKQRLSSRLNFFLHRACCVSDRKGAGIVLASLAALHSSRAVQTLKRKRLLWAFRKLSRWRPVEGLEGLLRCCGRRYRHSTLRVLLHAWLRASSPSSPSTSVQGSSLVQDTNFLSFQVSLQAVAWEAWRRAATAASLQRHQDALDEALNTNLELVQDCQEIAVKVGLQRLVATVGRACRRRK
ncbi:unnamed protein product, partial [Symbiodinium pilosum]